MTHRDDGWDIVDSARSVRLDDVGAPGYDAVVLVADNGSTYFMIADRERLGDVTAVYDITGSQTKHEQLGALPLDVVRRIAIARRQQRRAGG